MKTGNETDLHGAAVTRGYTSPTRGSSRGVRTTDATGTEVYPATDLEFVGATVVDLDNGRVQIIVGGGSGSGGSGGGGSGTGGTGGGAGGINGGGGAGSGVLRLNNSGTDLGTGAVVVSDETADRAVTTTTTAGDTRIAGVLLEPIAGGAIGVVLFNGYTPEIITTGTVTRGQYFQTSAVAGAAQTTAARTAGSFAVCDAASDVPDFVTEATVTTSDTPVTSLAITLPTATAGQELFLALYRDPAVTTAVTLTGWTRIGSTSGFWYYRKLATGSDTATATWSTTSPVVAIACLLIDGVEIATPVQDFAYDSTTGAAAVSGLDATRQRYAIAGVQATPSTPTDWTAIGSGLGQAVGAGTPTDIAAGITPTNDASNTQNWNNLAYVTDGNASTGATVGVEYLGGAPWTDLFVITFASTTVASFYQDVSDGNLDQFVVYQYWDGAAWQTPAGTWVNNVGKWTFTFTTPTATTKMRFGYTGAASLHGNITVQTVSIYGVADQTAKGSLFGQFIDRDAAVTSPFTGAVNQKDAIFALNLAAAVRPSALLYGPDLSPAAGATATYAWQPLVDSGTGIPILDSGMGNPIMAFAPV